MVKISWVGGSARRFMMMSVAAVLFMVIVLYATQPILTNKTIFQTYRANARRKGAEHPVWTWSCVDNHCERRPIVSNLPVRSFLSCNMQCGSTQLWPQPTGEVRLGANSVSFNSGHITLTSNATDPEVERLLNDTFQVFKHNVKAAVKNSYSSDVEVDGLAVVVHIGRSKETYLTLESDESYNLTLMEGNSGMVATVTATSFFGARHGLETLTQLMWFDEEDNVPRVLKAASIQDSPKFRYRGLMLDTSRNFFSVAAICRTLDGMAASKLNTFHWHITDSQSFPFDSPRVPFMAKYGAYSPDETYGARDVTHVVEYARVRGIRVIIEIDTPAHSGNGWQWGYKHSLGELSLCINQEPWVNYCGEPPCGQLNPRNNHTYKILQELYTDILELSHVTDIFHLGGDEVNLECWAQHFKDQNLDQLWGEFTLLALGKLTNANKGKTPKVVLLWSSNLTKRPLSTSYLDKSTFAIQIWGGSNWPENLELLEDGYQVLFSHVDAWYLDCGFGSWRSTGDAACSPYRTWKQVYAHRPWVTLDLPPDKRKLVLGGEACMWTEQVGEASLDSRLWPRASALAERLWSDMELEPDSPLMEDVFTRFNTHRANLVARGIEAEALWPKFCEQNPGKCL